MRRTAIIDLDILFRRFADEILHPIDYPASLVHVSEPDKRDRSVYVLTDKGDDLFYKWIKQEGIVFILPPGPEPEPLNVPLRKTDSDPERPSPVAGDRGAASTLVKA